MSDGPRQVLGRVGPAPVRRPPRSARRGSPARRYSADCSPTGRSPRESESRSSGRRCRPVRPAAAARGVDRCPAALIGGRHSITATPRAGVVESADNRSGRKGSRTSKVISTRTSGVAGTPARTRSCQCPAIRAARRRGRRWAEIARETSTRRVRSSAAGPVQSLTRAGSSHGARRCRCARPGAKDLPIAPIHELAPPNTAPPKAGPRPARMPTTKPPEDVDVPSLVPQRRWSAQSRHPRRLALGRARDR